MGICIDGIGHKSLRSARCLLFSCFPSIFESTLFLWNLPVAFRALELKLEQWVNQNSKIRHLKLFPALFVIYDDRPSLNFAQPLLIIDTSLGLNFVYPGYVNCK